MRNLKSSLAALCLCAVVLSGAAAEVRAQYGVSAYNPGNYSRTRQTMSNRAAVRAALRRKKQKQRRAANARLKRSRRTVN